VRTFASTVFACFIGCAGVRTPEPGVVTGRIRTIRPPAEPASFTFMDRSYLDRSLRIDAGGGVADAVIFLEGHETAPWVSGKASMTFGANQFDPRVAFVSPGQAVEIGDGRDQERHELVVNLKGLPSGDDRIHIYPDRRAPVDGPDRVRFCGAGNSWKREGRRFARGRTVEVTFDRTEMVPLDWD
jgi:hypothetical protein